MMQYNPFSLQGKTILVTGASSGIGRATAIECSRMGATVVITGRNEERLNETFLQLEGEGHQQIVADLCNQEDIDRLVNDCPEIQGLVNNAGRGNIVLVNHVKPEDMDYVYRANLFGPMMLTKGLLRKKKLRSGSSIVFSSSISSQLSTPANGIYASSKAAISSYMRTCAVELAPRGIRSNAVEPGTIVTALGVGALPEEIQQKDLELYPLKRYGRVEEVAYGIIYLLSDAAAWVTGTTLRIDGGRMLK